jgi:RNA polymerase sigma factor for flagellar operon FliA
MSATTHLDQHLREHAPLVRRLANHMSARLPASVEVDDLIQVGMLGLVEAIERFDPAQPASFKTFASQRIRGAMQDELRRCDWLPREMRQRHRAAAQAFAHLHHALQRVPRECEVAKALGMPLADYQRLRTDLGRAQLVSMESLPPGLDFPDTQADDAQDLAAQRAALAAAIRRLPPRQQQLMSLRYEHEMNFKHIGAVLGLTESMACRLHMRAVAWICVNINREAK